MDEKKILRIKDAVKRNFEQSPDKYSEFENKFGFFYSLNSVLLERLKIHSNARVLDIGCGSGEVSYGFWKMGCEVHSIDCNPATPEFFEHTSSNFFGESDDKHTLYIGPAGQFLDCIPENLDTVLLVESIEHIISDEWSRIFSAIKPVLQRNHGRLIIANTIWPLGGPMDPANEHISRIDDDFFNRLIQHDHPLVLYRNLGNLCLQY